MRVLVTGHNGYIGSAMVPLLQEAGHEVVGLDTFYYEDCVLGQENGDVPSIRRDIREVTPADVLGFDAVIHLAALCNDPLGNLNSDWTMEINHRASVRLARLTKDAGVRRFLFASSCSMYGASGDDLLTEEAPLRPITAYAESKVRTEEDLAKLADATFSPVFLRNATAYGVSARHRADVVLNNLVGWAHTTGKIKIMSDGTPWRPIVHIADISQVFALALEAPRDMVHNQAFNVGAPSENHQVRDLAEFVREAVPGCTIEYAGDGKADPRNYRVDFGKLQRTFPGYVPRFDARRGAQELIAAYRQANLSFEDFTGRKFNRLLQLRHLMETGRVGEGLRWKDGIGRR